MLGFILLALFGSLLRHKTGCKSKHVICFRSMNQVADHKENYNKHKCHADQLFCSKNFPTDDPSREKESLIIFKYFYFNPFVNACIFIANVSRGRFFYHHHECNPLVGALSSGRICRTG